MRIEQLMIKRTVTCRTGDSLREAARLMRDHDRGCLPVTADDASERLLGMITDRDICMAIRSDGGDPGELRVEGAMTESVRACNPGDPVSEAMVIMGEVLVRRLPVVDGSERVIGLITLGDLAREAARQTAREIPEITMSEIGGLLARICGRRDGGDGQPDG